MVQKQRDFLIPQDANALKKFLIYILKFHEIILILLTFANLSFVNTELSDRQSRNFYIASGSHIFFNIANLLKNINIAEEILITL